MGNSETSGWRSRLGQGNGYPSQAVGTMEIDHIGAIDTRMTAGSDGAGGQCNARVTSLVLAYTDGPQHLNPVGPHETIG